LRSLIIFQSSYNTWFVIIRHIYIMSFLITMAISLCYHCASITYGKKKPMQQHHNDNELSLRVTIYRLGMGYICKVVKYTPRYRSAVWIICSGLAANSLSLPFQFWWAQDLYIYVHYLRTHRIATQLKKMWWI